MNIIDVLMWIWLALFLSCGLMFWVALTTLSVLISTVLSLMLPSLSFNPYRDDV